MTPIKLFSPAAMALHLILFAGFLLYARVFGPPAPPSIDVPFKPLATSAVQQDTKHETEIDQSLLLTERRPGSMSHQGFYEREGKLWGRLENRWVAELTLNDRVQRASEYHFSKSKAAMGALAMVEVNTGKVVGLSEFIDRNHPVTRRLRPSENVHLALQAIAPSAGLFRIVTTASLLEKGLNPLQRFCYTKFKGTLLQSRHLSNQDPNACNHLIEAMSVTDNSYLAWVSHSELSSDLLKKTALNLGFDQRYSYFGLPYELSVAHIPSDPLRRAKTAVGFRGSKANVLHAALMMGAVATDGTLRSPRLVENIRNEEGTTVTAPDFPPMSKGISASTSARIKRIMKNAIHESPTGKVFQDWPDHLRSTRVAGQASVRTYRKPSFTRYTWFVGYMPAEDPKWAIAVMVVNHERWYVRALDIAHRVLKDVLSDLTQEP